MRPFLALILVAACGGSSSPPPAAPTQPTTTTATDPAPSTAKILVNVDADGIGVAGYDLISYTTGKKIEPGDQEYAGTHGGATYWFATPERKATFDAAPQQYAPQYGGYCAYAASEGRLSEVQPEVFEIVDGQLLLFTNPEYKRLFDQDPAGNKKKADEQWPMLVEKHGK